VDKEVMRSMMPYFGAKFGNAGSLHSFGQESVNALDRSRELIANSIGANFREIIFTGSATEANNHALRGVFEGFRVKGVGSSAGKNDGQLHPTGYTLRPKILISAIEHESVAETAHALEMDGAEVVIIPVDKRGLVDMKKLRNAIDERTVLVSVMYANNEIGTIQPIFEIAQIIRGFRAKGVGSSGKQGIEMLHPTGYTLSPYPLFHTDAVQAFQFLDCNVDALGVDLMTLSAHKLYGPKGVGALYVRQQIANRKSQIAPNERLATSDTRLAPILAGGGQEFGLRSGTENIPLIVGFAKAVELVSARRKQINERIFSFLHYYHKKLKKIYPKLIVNGPGLEKGTPRLPNILNVRIPGIPAEELLMRWDLAGLAVSGGSACSARSNAPSRVLLALGCSESHARESVRFSFGAGTTKQEVDKALMIIEKSKIGR
jgi:cysteine desulfurase